eukprot:CAMPEP_0182450112 /NCGR_PEP_ID=MMETSP1172-20130603/39037_1 /TAXON_ID=708627 /ORGANISM="Timspurckia oligopyrenoides, Strain CCMP3278" /LENGTH=593 /DNA_ID=CAMNT_0024647615 /DNA_START=263 /DNA_END=2044 /DNA_ORIENTATION=+
MSDDKNVSIAAQEKSSVLRCPVDHNQPQSTMSKVGTDAAATSAYVASLEPPPPLTSRDTAQLWWTNILQTYGNLPSVDGAPKVEGSASDLLGDQPFFIALAKYFKEYGSVFKLAFGPKVFFVVSDPVIARYVLRENSHLYDKGVLAEILAPIMGKGLIPADFETWKKRRRAIVPGFHKKWLERMTDLFGECSDVLMTELNRVSRLSGDAGIIDMETAFCSVSLDIIGKAVFNYEFGSVTKGSPIIKAVYNCLREAEHRSTFLLPYWKFEPMNWIVPRQRKFRRDMQLINDTLDELINAAVASKDEADLDALENRDYMNAQDPSLLRFLVDLRGEDVTCSQLRDDLMTMLIAGHETTAALLTWATYQLCLNPEELKKAQEEVDRVLGSKSTHPTMENVRAMPYIRRVLAETLRLYPEPPLLIRRALQDHSLPQASGVELKLLRGNDLFLCMYTLHRHPDLWENPDKFDPDRFLRPFSNPAVHGWKGYTPAAIGATSLYPNEVDSDFAFLPFGGGTRKCVGDQFSMLEATVCLSMMLQRFEVELLDTDVPMTTGATIHTKNGLRVRIKRRESFHKAVAERAEVSSASSLESTASV